MTLLVAYDSTSSGHEAAMLGGELAQRLAEDLVLVHAIDPQVGVVGEAVATSMAADAAQWTRAEETLSALATELRGAFGVTVQTVVELGYFETVLLRHAEAVSATLIIAPNHRASALERWLVDSPVERLLERTTVPVLVVDNPTSLRTALQGARPPRLAVAVAPDASSDAALNWTEFWLRHIQGTVVVVRMVDVATEAPRLGLAPDAPATTDLLLARHRDDLERRCASLTLSAPVELRVHVASQGLATDLVARCIDVRADLIVVGTEQASLWRRLREGSTATALALETRLPVLCVPAKLSATTRRRPAFRRVLVPIDRSDASLQAIEYAYALMGEPGATLELVHIVERATRDAALGPNEVIALEQELRALVAEETWDIGVRATVVEGSDVVGLIDMLAERYDVDAICMTTRGRGAVASAVLGSVAQGLLTRSKRPLLLIR